MVPLYDTCKQYVSHKAACMDDLCGLSEISCGALELFQALLTANSLSCHFLFGLGLPCRNCQLLTANYGAFLASVQGCGVAVKVHAFTMQAEGGGEAQWFKLSRLLLLAWHCIVDSIDSLVMLFLKRPSYLCGTLARRSEIEAEH